MLITEKQKQWIIGFSEGDGSVGIHTDHYHNSYAEVAYGQQERGVLDFISLFFGNNVRKCKLQYELKYTGTKALPLLEMFRDETITEHFTFRLNNVFQFLNLRLAGLSITPNIDWLVGFWDADGYSNNKPEICIEQKELYVLEVIKQNFGGIIIYHPRQNGGERYRWCLCGKKQAYPLAQGIAQRSLNILKAHKLQQNFEGLTYQQINREQINIQHRKYYKEHPEQMKARRQKHAEYNREYHRKWREQHKDISKERRQKCSILL